MTEQDFSDAAVESAQAFRAIMQAMARPGSVIAMEPRILAPGPLHATAAAIALTLCDYQTPIWLPPRLRTAEVIRYLKFHAGAPVTERMEDAQFAFLPAGEDIPPFRLFAQGTHEFPDRSVTLVVMVEGFGHPAVILSGPGLPSPRAFGAAGLPPAFWQAMIENHAQFPVGADVILAGPRSIAALPRSTAVKILETV